MRTQTVVPWVLIFLALVPLVEGQEEPKDSPSFTRLGIMTVRAGRFEEGIKHLDRAILLDKDNSLAYYWRGRANMSLGHFEAALKDLSKVIELDPEEPTAYVERAQVRKELKDESGARADMDKAVQLQPSLAQPPKEVKETPAIEKDPPVPPAPVVKKSKELENPESPKPTTGKPEDKEEPAPAVPVADRVRNEKSKEISLHNRMGKLIDLTPDLLTAEKYLNFGLAKLNLHSYSDAVWYFTKAIKLDPKLQLAYTYRGETKNHMGNYKGAIEDLDAAIRLNPRDVSAMTWRSESKYRLKEYKEAIEDATEAIRLNPEHAQAYIRRAEARRDLLAGSGKIIPEVNADLEKARKLLPKTARGYFDLGAIHFRYGQFREAIADYDEAIKLDPRYGEAYANRGYMKYRLGDYKNAVADYEKSLELTPYDKDKMRKLIQDAKSKMR